MGRYSRGNASGGRVEGFPEPCYSGGSRSPKGITQKVLDARKVLVVRLRGKSYRGKSLLARARFPAR